jgi:hypothetical protein
MGRRSGNRSEREPRWRIIMVEEIRIANTKSPTRTHQFSVERNADAQAGQAGTPTRGAGPRVLYYIWSWQLSKRSAEYCDHPLICILAFVSRYRAANFKMCSILRSVTSALLPRGLRFIAGPPHYRPLGVGLRRSVGRYVFTSSHYISYS